MEPPLKTALVLALVVSLAGVQAQETRLTVQAGQVIARTSRYLTGLALCDVNHEVYGGLYSQMIFGEHFSEPAMEPPIQGFTTWHGGWRCTDDGGAEVTWSGLREAGLGADGSALICDKPGGASGEASVEVWLTDKTARGCGLLLRAGNRSAVNGGPTGLAVLLNGQAQKVSLGLYDLKLSPPVKVLQEAAWPLPQKTWIKLSAKWTGSEVEALVNGKSAFRHDYRNDFAHPGRFWGLLAKPNRNKFRNLQFAVDGQRTPIALVADTTNWDHVSRCWRAMRKGTAIGNFALVTEKPLAGTQCQRMEFVSGEGETGLVNQGLHHWGMNWIGGHDYEGMICARSEKTTALYTALESEDGTRVYAEQELNLKAGEWRKLEFKLTPAQSDSRGRFAIKLKSPGAVDVGYAFIQPGEWGRYKGLPVRRDIVEEMLANGVSAIRFSATLAWATNYHWKLAAGPRELRPPFEHFFYPYSSGGWSWLELLDLCDAAGLWPIPDFTETEKPQDLVDFIEYANGSPQSHWGRQRVAHGHPAPFNIRHIQLGNERDVNEKFVAQLRPLIEAIWAKDPKMIIIVGTWAIHSESDAKAPYYGELLKLAKTHDAEIWFDAHNEGKAGQAGFLHVLRQLAGGAKFKVVVLELNSTEHNLGRALGLAESLGGLAELAQDVPLVCTSNALEPDCYCDNGWSQGLVFFNPAKAWTQPPGYVHQMIASSRLPLMVKSDLRGAEGRLFPVAETDAARAKLTLRVVNASADPVRTELELHGFLPAKTEAQVLTLMGRRQDVNTAERPDAISPRPSAWRHDLRQGPASFVFPPNSFTVLRFE